MREISVSFIYNEIGNMFEVDEWDLSTDKEEKLMHGLFGDKPISKRKRKNKEKTQTARNEKNKEANYDLSYDMETKKTKIIHTEPKTTEVKKSVICTTRKRTKKNESRNENIEGLHVNMKLMKSKEDFPKGKEKEKKDEKSGGNGTKIKKKKRKKLKKLNKEMKAEVNSEEDSMSAVNNLSYIQNLFAKQTFVNKEPILPRTGHSKKSELQEKLKKRLESSRFRWINEQLYTIPGDEAFSLFEHDESLFEVYHQGFRQQVQQWPINPVDVIIDWAKQRSSSLVLADFGCGEAVIAQSVPNKVHSFDLVAVNDRVTACNMAKVPLNSASIDVAIFCLSLMGTDLQSFLTEAHRVLKPGGVLKIAEVVSRMETTTFIPALCQLGFKLHNLDDSNKMFILLDFIKVKDPQNKGKEKCNLSGLELKPCIYKRR